MFKVNLHNMVTDTESLKDAVSIASPFLGPYGWFFSAVTIGIDLAEGNYGSAAGGLPGLIPGGKLVGSGSALLDDLIWGGVSAGASVQGSLVDSQFNGQSPSLKSVGFAGWGAFWGTVMP